MEKQKIKELAKFLGCNKEGIFVSDWSDWVFELANEEYLVVTDEEAAEEVTSRIAENIWAFNAKFILYKCGIGHNEAAISSLQEMQNRCCESCNPFLLSLIENTCGLDSFVQEAISRDGRGHFLARYDSVENKTDSYYVYRLN